MLQHLPKRILSRSAKSIINPARVMSQLKIREGDKVLELGLPVGFFARALAAQVGEYGSVIVAGPNKESFEKLDADIHHYPNISTVRLAQVLSQDAAVTQSLDVIILTNLLSNVKSPSNFCLSLNYYLKTDGRVILIDWETEGNLAGPDSSVRMPREEAVKLLAQCGFEFERALQIPGYHYGLVFTQKLE